MTQAELLGHPELLRIGGTWLEEVYFEFQFDGSTIHRDLGDVVLTLRAHYDDLTIADWLARPNEALAGVTPLRFIAAGGNSSGLRAAARQVPPIT